MLDCCDIFAEKVSWVEACVDELHLNVSVVHLLANEVMPDIDVLCLGSDLLIPRYGSRFRVLEVWRTFHKKHEAPQFIASMSAGT